MKKNLTRWTALLLIIALLSACGRAPETTAAPTAEAEDVTGRYYLVGSDGRTAGALNEKNYLRLKDDGKAIYQLGEDQLEYKWKLKDDGMLTLSLDGEKDKGTLKDGVITIVLDGRSRVFVSGKNAAQRYIEEHPNDSPTATAVVTEPETGSPAGTTASAETPSSQSGKPFDPDVRFTAVDQNGRTVDETVFQDYVITMINFWEPWCGPCVGEMPDLEKLYQERDDLLIIGVYSTQDGMAEVLKETGVTYPVILYDSVFDRYQTGYVPTTIFVDPGGHVIGSPMIGSQSYAEWNDTIRKLIGK